MKEVDTRCQLSVCVSDCASLRVTVSGRAREKHIKLVSVN